MREVMHDMMLMANANSIRVVAVSQN